MSYTNVYPSRINWENEPSIASPINATNLNKLDYAAYEFDQTFATWDITKANQSDLLLSVKSIDYDTETGVFVFTWQNGTTKTVDLNIEKIPVSFSMSPQGVITMTTDDGTTYTADVGSLIKTYTFTDSTEIDFTVTTDQSGNKTITAAIKDGSIVGTKLEPNYLANCQSAANSASASKTAAEGSAEDSEAWAVGERDGVPVPSSDPAYNNNSKYWAQHTSASLAGLTDTDITSPTNGQVLTYDGTKWVNDDPSAGGGSKVVVSTAEASLIGTTCTLSQGGDSYTATFSNSGVATFEGVTLTGTVTITATDGQSTATRTLEIPYFGNYTQTVSFFSATITATFPEDKGATCTCDGVTASTSPYTFTVGAAGTYSVVCTLDGVNKSVSVPITTDGQAESVNFAFGTINLTYDNAFRGLTITCVNGGTTISKTAPISGNTMAFYPPSTGEWVISATYSGVPYQTSATITSLATPVSASLQQVPNGKTVTPTDDIQKWLNCAGIFDKVTYTTLADVLADSTTLLALMSNNNAVDYLVRSKTWSGNGQALVPVMTSATTPSGEVTCSSEYSGRNGWKAFSGGVSSTSNNGWCASSKIANSWVQYAFTSSVIVTKVTYQAELSGGSSLILKLQGSNDGTTFTDIETLPTLSNDDTHTENVSNNLSYTIYRIVDTTGDTYNSYGLKLQFYAPEGICADSTAMTDIGANNYCANTLLDDATWCDAICNSTYFESVLNVKVPTMTSNTTPVGECIYYSSGSTIATFANQYKAWDNDDSTLADAPSNLDQGDSYSYHFTSPVIAKKCRVKVSNGRTYTFKIQAYNGTSWNDVSDTITNDGNVMTIVLSGNSACTAYRVFRVSGNSSMMANSIQFYGR